MPADPPTADLAATVRLIDAMFDQAVTPSEYERIRPHVTALVARCEQLERERDEAVGRAAEWKERLELTLDACPDCGGTGQVEVPERNMCAACDGGGMVSAAWMYERLALLEAALREIQERQPKTLERLREQKIVFDQRPQRILPDLPTNWQQVAFWIYTDLCKTESIARAALGGADA